MTEEATTTIDADKAESLGELIGLVLEMLTMYAVDYGPYYITADEDRAITILAVEDDAKEILSLLPNKFKSWEEIQNSVMDDYIADADPGDEQDEPASESE